MRIETRVTPALVRQVHKAIGADLGLIRLALEELERQEQVSPHKLVRQIRELSHCEIGATIREVLAEGDAGEVGSTSDYIIFVRDLILEAGEEVRFLTKEKVKIEWDERLRRHREAERGAIAAAVQLEVLRCQFDTTRLTAPGL